MLKEQVVSKAQSQKRFYYVSLRHTPVSHPLRWISQFEPCGLPCNPREMQTCRLVRILWCTFRQECKRLFLVATLCVRASPCTCVECALHLFAGIHCFRHHTLARRWGVSWSLCSELFLGMISGVSVGLSLCQSIAVCRSLSVCLSVSLVHAQSIASARHCDSVCVCLHASPFFIETTFFFFLSLF